MPRKSAAKLVPPPVEPNNKAPESADAYCGQRVRLARRTLGQSQQALAEAIGVSFQQVQKYENGANRISISRLVMIANYLHKPVGFFFDGMPGSPDGSGGPLDERTPSTFEAVVIARLLAKAAPTSRQRAVAVVKALVEVDADA